MKNPKDPSDPLNRHNAAGEQTVIIGEPASSNNNNSGSSSNAQTSLVSGSAATARQTPANVAKPICS